MMKIGNKTIENSKEPYLIAEIGVNYYDIAEKENVSLVQAAKIMIEKAAEAGVDAVKFQTYKAEKLASKNSPAYWDTEEESTTSQYELFKKYDRLNDADYLEIAEYTKKNCGITFLSTPFDFDAVDFLDEIMPVFKVASADITNFPLLEHIAKKGKPVILSTGASTISEIYEAVELLHDNDIKDKDIALLHCVLDYPTKKENANLNMIKHLKNIFINNMIGYSDHVPPDDSMITLLNAYIKGADIIEKHFTLDKSISGNDHYHAMDPEDIKVFVRNLKILNETSGKYFKKPLETEKNSIRYARRSIVAEKEIKKGEMITEENITFKRPGTGISPKHINFIIGKVAKRDIEEDAIIDWGDL